MYRTNDGPPRHRAPLLLGFETAAILMAVALSLMPGPAAGQSVRFEVRDVALELPEPAGAEAPLVEPHLSVDPDDPDRLVVGVIVVAPRGPTPWHCAVGVSPDRGRSWSRTDFRGMERCIDPWVVQAAESDTALFTGIEIRSDADTDPERFRLILHRSTDGARSWSAEPDTLGRGFDHDLIVPGGSAHHGALYVASRRNATSPSGRPRHRIWVGRLEDGGRSLRRSSSLPTAAMGQNATGVLPLSDGTLVVTWWDFQREVDGFRAAGVLERGRAWAARSTDGGRTFGEAVMIGECASGGLARAFPGYPYATADRGDGPYRDRAYHACIRPELDGVDVSRSVDGGLRWSDAVRVDLQDGEGSPHARTPMLATGPDGTVAVAWYDRRNDPDEACQDVYLAVSTDGGESFGSAVRVTTRMSCPLTEDNGRAARSWAAGGDYSSLAAGPDGTFHLVWADSRSGRFRLRRAAFAVEPP